MTTINLHELHISKHVFDAAAELCQRSGLPPHTMLTFAALCVVSEACVRAASVDPSEAQIEAVLVEVRVLAREISRLPDKDQS